MLKLCGTSDNREVSLHPSLSRVWCVVDPNWEPSNTLPDDIIGHHPNLAAFQLTATLPVNLELTFLGGLMETPTQSAETSQRLMPLGVSNLVRRGMAMILFSGNALLSPGPTSTRLKALTGAVKPCRPVNVAFLLRGGNSSHSHIRNNRTSFFFLGYRCLVYCNRRHSICQITVSLLHE